MPEANSAVTAVDPPDGARCRGCRYPLRGLPDHRCPECGREFDTGDARTMYLGPPWRGWLVTAHDALIDPIGRWYRWGVLAGSGMVLWGAAWLPGARVVELLGWTVMALTVVAALTRRRLRSWLRRRACLDPIGHPASEQFGRRAALLVLMAATSPLSWWPLRVSLFVQRPLLNGFGRYVYAERPMIEPVAGPRLVGGLVVSDAGAWPNGVTLTVWGGGTIHWRADGPPERGWDRYVLGMPEWLWWTVWQPTAGDWYVVPIQPREVWWRWRRGG